MSGGVGAGKNNKPVSSVLSEVAVAQALAVHWKRDSRRGRRRGVNKDTVGGQGQSSTNPVTLLADSTGACQFLPMCLACQTSLREKNNITPMQTEAPAGRERTPFTMKYILVTGGVISGIGKGIIASSVGTILKSCGLHVTSIKIDPYINIDAGTFSPYEHGNGAHITDAIQEWVMKQSKVSVDEDGVEPQVCVIELGGTVGDIESMPFIEAFRQFQFKVKRENFCNIHVSLVPQPNTTGEQKTKPTQNSVRELRGLGLSPDLVRPPLERVSIALVGKYTKLSDSYTSVLKALEHSALAINHKLEIKYIDSADLELDTQQNDPVKYHEAWQQLCSAHGVLVPGGFGVRGTEGKMLAINWARKQKKPFWTLQLLVIMHEPDCSCFCAGVCLGMQLAVCEFARDVLGWEDANSTEFNPETKHPVVIDMPEHNSGQMGGTMRLGKRRTIFTSANSVMRKLYGNVEYVDERHRHRFEVNRELKHHFEKKGFQFVGQDVNGERMEVIELDDHCYFVGVQYHPEFTSRPIKPSPPYFGLLLAAAGKLPGYLAKGCRLSPRDTYSDRSGSSSPDEDLTELKFPSL
ncbi:hypothetical protein WMY93_026901 [Mugilogobius chulae]|uniref:CTP synthase n=1 Tax=Mugilogobius chulae TaxID=88201 RepID=A0AAW0N380_9GOBI